MLNQDHRDLATAARGATLAPRRIAAVDGVRALACLMIFMYHTWQFAGSPAAGPLTLVRDFPAGVDLFMVLSGFCLYYPLARRSSGPDGFSWRTYARRRLRRIAPPYYAAIAYAIVMPEVLVLVFRLAGAPADVRPLPGLGDLVQHLTFTHTLFRQHWDGINGSFWSLGLEAQFYLLFPLLVLIARRSVLKAVAGAVLLSVTYRVVLDVAVGGDFPGDWLWTVTGVGRWMQFAMGMLAATVVGRGVDVRARGWQLIGLAVVLYAAAVRGPDTVAHVPARDLLLAVSFALLLVSACVPGRVQRLFASRPLVGLGAMSYSVFLIHQPTAYYFQQGLEKVLHVSGPGATLALLWTVGLALVLAIARVFFLAFERPFLTARPGSAGPHERGVVLAGTHAARSAL